MGGFFFFGTTSISLSTGICSSPFGSQQALARSELNSSCEHGYRYMAIGTFPV